MLELCTNRITGDNRRSQAQAHADNAKHPLRVIEGSGVPFFKFGANGFKTGGPELELVELPREPFRASPFPQALLYGPK